MFSNRAKNTLIGNSAGFGPEPQERVIDLLQQRETGDTIPYDCRLFGSEANHEDCEEKQNTKAAFVGYDSTSPYRDTAITV